MKKLSIVLPTLLCVGATTLGSVSMSMAQATPPTYEVAVEQGKQNLKVKDYMAAEKGAQESLLLAQSPEETGGALMLLAETLYQRKMYEQSNAQWDKVAKLDDPEGEGAFQLLAHIGLARNYKGQGKAEKAIAEYELALASIDTLKLEQGETYKKDDASGAIAAISLAKANVYLGDGQIEQAKEQFNRILQNNVNDPATYSLALFNLAKIDVLQNNFTKSLKKFNDITNIKGVPLSIKTRAESQIVWLTPILPLEAKAQDLNDPEKISVKLVDDISTKIDEVINALIFQSL